MPEVKRVLVIGGKGRQLRKAKALGLDVLYIQKPGAFSESDLAYADQTFLIDYADLNALASLVQGIQRAYPFQHVASITEAGLIPAAHVNDVLGLGGNSVDTARLLMDKWAMRQRLNSLGISPVAARVGCSEADLTEGARELGMPLIVKPVDGTGSASIHLIRQPEELKAAWAQMSELGIGTFIMEEYLDGSEISVEAFTLDGRHRIVAMTDKLTLANFVECGHCVPAQLSEETAGEVERCVMALLETVGIKQGPTHTELKLTTRGPRIIESHNRVGGDRITELVRLAYGVDLVALTFGAPFGLIAFPDAISPQAGAVIRFLTPTPGIVRAVSGVDEVRSLAGVTEVEVAVKVGDMVRPVRQSQDRVGHIIARSSSVQEASALCDEAARQMRIVTESV